MFFRICVLTLILLGLTATPTLSQDLGGAHPVYPAPAPRTVLVESWRLPPQPARTLAELKEVYTFRSNSGTQETLTFAPYVKLHKSGTLRLEAMELVVPPFTEGYGYDGWRHTPIPISTEPQILKSALWDMEAPWQTGFEEWWRGFGPKDQTLPPLITKGQEKYREINPQVFDGDGVFTENINLVFMGPGADPVNIAEILKGWDWEAIGYDPHLSYAIGNKLHEARDQFIWLPNGDFVNQDLDVFLGSIVDPLHSQVHLRLWTFGPWVMASIHRNRAPIKGVHIGGKYKIDHLVDDFDQTAETLGQQMGWLPGFALFQVPMYKQVCLEKYDETPCQSGIVQVVYVPRIFEWETPSVSFAPSTGVSRMVVRLHTLFY